MISTNNFMDCQKSQRKIIARSVVTVFNDENVVEIEDVRIDGKNWDLGNGTILLKNLEQLCRKRGKNKIVGSLKWVDKENFVKLEYFYKKNGFVVTFNEERTGGKIVKTLD
ncbi:GNAT family N-acetyltransferase [Carnobacterium maltaromaticum]|uniref:GNAT family N-acetyltransferase n=1 Tax=Carnobacterium maltaromaticum TaxID=2751 RepID=UPI00295E624F|nr:GNAT family N-acetyltransferase [Carnobacterium maltaromaticum]